MVLLTVSQIRPPPQNFLRHFYIGDQKRFTMHLAEAVASIFVLGAWCIAGTLNVWFFLPYFLVSLVPMIILWCPQGPTRRCLWESLRVVVTMIALPALIVVGLAVLLYKHPKKFVHPLDAAWHIYVAIASMVLCLACQSNLPVVALWAGHSLLVAIGLLEQLFVKRWQWHAGPAWWFALQLTAFAAYIANLYCTFPKGVAYKGSTNAVVRLEALAWAALVTALVVRTHWTILVWWYQNWQQRHGHFTLNVPSDDGQAEGRQNGNALPM
mmetsp:Transcript_46492/g.85196  ORF Transcript_46492/g.85196 Transcript_46492/m.85196 type:complete len:268 (+) Transcript_46492:3-806(+)